VSPQTTPKTAPLDQAVSPKIAHSSAQANRISKYSSDYGTIPGLFAPNEAGGLWNLWNAHGDWNDETFLPELPVDRMRKTLTAISTITGNPFVNKNVMHANRIRMLDAVFPGCLFIEVRRNPREVARSIIRAQPEEKSPQPQSDGWWSVRPLNATGTHPVEQAVRQIEGVTADIARDTEALIRPCLYTVEYESFCAAPEVEMYKVAEFLSTHGVEIAVRSKIPDAFELRPSTPLLAKDEERLDESMCRTRTGADTP